MDHGDLNNNERFFAFVSKLRGTAGDVVIAGLANPHSSMYIDCLSIGVIFAYSIFLYLKNY